MKEKLRSFRRWPHFWLAVIITVSALLHLGLMWFPNELVLDEQYYIEGARSYLEGGALQQPEHPSLGKAFITAGVWLFGDNQFGWRFMPVLFGLAAILFFYLICRELKLSPTVTNIVTALFAFENSAFLMASVAMLDIFSIALMLGGFWAYLGRRYPLAAAILVLALLCKLTAALGIVAVGLHWLFFRRDRLLTVAASGLVAYLGIMALIPLTEVVLTGTWNNPFTRIGEIIYIPTTITFENSSHPSAIHPWQWVLTYQVMPFWWTPQYISAINPTIWLATLPTFFFTAWLGLSKKQEAAYFAAAWIFTTLIVWIILGFITDRITYIFYFAPVAGGVALAIGVFMDKAVNWGQERGRGRLVTRLIAVFVIIHLLFFLALSPFTGLWPVSA
ncbi:MAG: glycosyltransferase family 39 protein [Dehalogenimonas sp.]|uniref:Glycosyltransferase family 39 protein n=1 Tax=Candidatus Dehalogenimonas loeffleri TaxID=3127115 RepID=A0ABZ2J4R7_9CHLR|nr:glycosyltransferase family 39 protein [Dehalogenimonas sp.]